jgi:NAD(P)-dependent dehydrogenase (short-subunit alcohol dehydrogenase family)
VITGASSGIGRAAALAFAGKGRGVLVNNASMVATLAEPYAAPDVVAKHGLRGLGMTLRQELALEGARESGCARSCRP